MTRPRVEIGTHLKVGPEGTTVTFDDVDVSPCELKEGDLVVVTSRAMNLAGYARVQKILHPERQLVLDLNWSQLEPLRLRRR